MRQLPTVLGLSAIALWAASARPVQANPCPSAMVGIAAQISPTWNVSAGYQNSISDLFLANGSCATCHDAGGSAANKYMHCGSCHASTSNANLNTTGIGRYPDWLIFDSAEKLYANSYYAPGYTKAQASLFRVLDGTMPPLRVGATTNPARPLAWCDEIIRKYQVWIEAGYP